MSRVQPTRNGRSSHCVGHVVSRFTNQVQVFRHFWFFDEASQHFAAPDNDAQVIAKFVRHNQGLRDWWSFVQTAPSALQHRFFVSKRVQLSGFEKNGL
jgi:hypothetical protein